MSHEIFLAAIVSFDTFLAASALSSSGIRIPPPSAAIINIIGASVLALSIGFSRFLGEFIPADIFSMCGTILLAALGTLTIMKSLVRNLVRTLSEKGELSLKIKGSALVLKLYLDDTAADIDDSKFLSPLEAAALAAASSLDSAATGLSCGAAGFRPVISLIYALIFGAAAVFFGSLTGRKISSLKHDLSWPGGVLLILLAFIK